MASKSHLASFAHMHSPMMMMTMLLLRSHSNLQHNVERKKKLPTLELSFWPIFALPGNPFSKIYVYFEPLLSSYYRRFIGASALADKVHNPSGKQNRIEEKGKNSFFFSQQMAI